MVGIQCLLGVLLFFLIDGAIFRSGWYFRRVAPLSSLGQMAIAIDDIRHIPTGKHAVLVIGDSRAGEGFSMPTAQRAASAMDLPYVFYNAAVAGTTPRVWYYLLRQIDNPGERLAAVAVMVTSYHDDEPEDLAERPSDIAFVHPLLTLTDLTDFPGSFPSGATRLQAVEAILFKGLFYGADVRSFLANPAERIRSVAAWHRHGFEWIRNYPGRDPSLQGLGLDLTTGKLTVPAGAPSLQTDMLPSYAEELRRFHGRPPDNAGAAAYRREWLGRIAALCRQANVRLFVYRIPRGPLHDLVDADDAPTGVLADMAQAGSLELLPARLFDDLERPEFFFDRLHMDSAGRALFSDRLARAIMLRLQAAP